MEFLCLCNSKVLEMRNTKRISAMNAAEIDEWHCSGEFITIFPVL